ncbi:hypothetical protein J2X26_002131 [Cellulomonas humilata]|uniref:Uncharacterized protein n=1 Tax=Cellulomonas humilata TaxID=144055 RepID=A0ABU0EEW2_9CELL|nr:hypothetical protein [Cellulomonas humilata]
MPDIQSPPPPPPPPPTTVVVETETKVQAPPEVRTT